MVKVLRMKDLESLAVDLIQLPPRTLPEDWIAVTVDDVAEMLRQARVREPWHNPELGCYSLAQCINLPLGYRSINSAGKMISKERLGRDPGVNDGKPARTKADRARDAIDELRRALPSAIAEFESSVAQSSRWYLSPPSHAQEMRAIQRSSAGNREVRDSEEGSRSVELATTASKAASKSMVASRRCKALAHLPLYHRCLRWYLPRGTWGPFYRSGARTHGLPPTSQAY